jgi:hypothetical protein
MDAAPAAAELYRTVIDTLVRSSLEGQGQTGPKRVRAGVWHGAGTDRPSDAEVLLAKLDRREREILAGILLEMFVSGVHETLAVLHRAEVAPFDKSYDKTPFHDFVGRLDGSQWPADSERQGSTG